MILSTRPYLNSLITRLENKELISSVNKAICTNVKALEQESTLDKMRATLSNAIQDTVEELNHIATEPYDVDDYQEGVTDGIQLAIRTINTKIKEVVI